MHKSAPASIGRVVWLLLLGICLVFVVVWTWRARNRLPDLSRCTRIEVSLPHGAMRHFFPIKELNNVFDANELVYIRSCDTWVVEDPCAIEVFAKDVSQGAYQGQKRGETSPGIEIICYRDSIRVTSLEVLHERVTTSSGAVFRYPWRRPDMSILEPQVIQRLRPRWWCALSIGSLHVGHVFMGRRQGRPYPAPTQWCDAVVEGLRQYQMSRGGEPMRRTYTDVQIAARFIDL